MRKVVIAHKYPVGTLLQNVYYPRCVIRYEGRQKYTAISVDPKSHMSWRVMVTVRFIDLYPDSWVFAEIKEDLFTKLYNRLK